MWGSHLVRIFLERRNAFNQFSDILPNLPIVSGPQAIICLIYNTEICLSVLLALKTWVYDITDTKPRAWLDSGNISTPALLSENCLLS